jgi:hypothetical protein
MEYEVGGWELRGLVRVASARKNTEENLSSTQWRLFLLTFF